MALMTTMATRTAPATRGVEYLDDLRHARLIVLREAERLESRMEPTTAGHVRITADRLADLGEVIRDVARTAQRDMRGASPDRVVPAGPSSTVATETKAPEDREARMLRLYVDERESMSEIGRRLGVHRYAVRYVLAREGVPLRPRGTGWSSDELVQWVRRRTVELGRAVRVTDMLDDDDGPCPTSIYRHVCRDGETVTEAIHRVLGIDHHSDRRQA